MIVCPVDHRRAPVGATRRVVAKVERPPAYWEKEGGVNGRGRAGAFRSCGGRQAAGRRSHDRAGMAARPGSAMAPKGPT